MILLLYQLHWSLPVRAHVAQAATLDEVLRGNWRCLCGATASGKRRWNVIQARRLPDGYQWCGKCYERARL